MIIAFFFNIITYCVIVGFSYVFLKFVLGKKNFFISNLDIFFGLLLLFICSNLISIFVSINKIQYFIILIGVYYFFVAYKNKIIRVNFLSLFILILIFTFISFYTGSNVDSPMYHLQILKWLIYHKTIFGISNLEIRFGTNSSWHTLIAILNIDFLKYTSKHYLSAVIFAISFNEIYSQKQKFIKFSNLYLHISFIILILYSLLHPAHNGMILNHLGNPELDLVPMLFFILSIYVLINFYNDQKNDNLFYLYCVLAFFTISSRMVYVPLILPILFQHFKQFRVLKKENLILISASFLWMLKSFTNSGCLIFPYKFTCLKTSWSPGFEKIDFFLHETMSFNRTGPLRSRYTDFDYTLGTTEWVVPWFKQYFLQTAFLNIFTIILIMSFILFIYSFFKNLTDKENFIRTKKDKIIILILISTLVTWFSAPETRLGWGILIAFPAFIFCYSVVLNYAYIIKKKIILKLLVGCQILLITGFVIKNVKFFNYQDLYVVNVKNFSPYTNIQKLEIYDNYQFYVSLDSQCADFKGFCVNKPRKNYKVKKIYGYKIINGE